MLAILALSQPVLSQEIRTATELFDSMPSKTVHEDDEGRKDKLHEYRGEKFRAFEQKNCRMGVEAMRVSGAAYVHQQTGLYRGGALGSGRWRAFTQGSSGCCM